jgi:hypothetical protein
MTPEEISYLTGIQKYRRTAIDPIIDRLKDLRVPIYLA